MALAPLKLLLLSPHKKQFFFDRFTLCFFQPFSIPEAFHRSNFIRQLPLLPSQQQRVRHG